MLNININAKTKVHDYLYKKINVYTDCIEIAYASTFYMGH